ncbi:MAG: glutamine--fructose-6-phosphate transaminase (isomerizing) [Patescibacteria group bacterium]
MCGIVGFIGKGNATDFVIKALKKLEYRGYDSWGISFVEDGELKVVKETGKIGEVSLSKVTSNAQIAIGHTRWATHGVVAKENAHPHTDCRGDIAVVHNGIINNYQLLKEKLIKSGHKFSSQTDTEVIPHLVEEYLKKMPIREAFRSALNDLQGDYAILLIDNTSKKLYLATSGLSLVIGVGKENFYISSDPIAFSNLTTDVFFLKDGILSEIEKEINFFDIKTGDLKKIASSKIATSEYEIGKGSYKHFLFKEINEQPEILEKIANTKESKEIETNAALIRNSFGTFFVACGTAYHAALMAEYLFAKYAKMHVNTSLASEFPTFENFITDKTLFFAISQSGETADVLEAVKSVKRKKAKIFSLLNNPDSTLARISDVTMLTPAGREIAVLSTKAFTSQVAVLYLLSLAIIGKLETGRKVVQKTALGIKESLKQANIDKIKILAQKIKNNKNLFTIGRSLNYPTALEAALKIKEASYIHAEGFAGGELKHGTIALIEKDVPCIVFVANDETKEEILSNAEEVKARGGYIIGVAPENHKVFDYWFKVADVPELSPIVNIVPIQVLAYFLALEKGLDPDKPRNLAKSVTVK